MVHRPRLITVFPTETPDTNARDVIVTDTFDQASLSIASLILLSYSTHAWHHHFPSILPLSLVTASLFTPNQLTRKPNCFEAPPFFIPS